MSLSEQSQQWYPTSVQVTVLQARGLRIKGKNGTNDAYAIMQVAKEKFSTSVAEKSVAPVWKEEAAFDLPLFHPGNVERCTLQVSVMHRALIGADKMLGMASVNLLDLYDNKSRNKTEWFKLMGKTGKPDKDRGEVLVDIQFMKNNMTASMFDLSGMDKSRSRLGKIKDKLKGKKKDGMSDSASAIVPSIGQIVTDSEGEEEAGATPGTKKKSKLKSLFAPKVLQRNMSQSMSTLPTLPEKNSALSLSRSSGLNVESPEGKKKFKLFKHKRNESTDSKVSQGAGSLGQGLTQSNLCINGSHVYAEETRESRAGSTFSLNSSGHGSMEDLRRGHDRKISTTSADSLKTTDPEPQENAVEEMQRRQEEQRKREQEEKKKPLEEEKRKRIEEQEREQFRREEMRKEEERKRIERAEERKRIEREEGRKRIEREEERKLIEREEERKLIEREEERKRIEREEEEEKRRLEKLEEEKRKIGREEERKRLEEEEKEKRRLEKLEEEKRRIGREEEEKRRLEKQEEERKLIEREREEQRRIEEEEEEMAKIKREQETFRREEEEKRIKEEKRRKTEEEERTKLEKERMKKDEEAKRIAVERLRKEKMEAEENRKRKEEEERRMTEEKELKERERVRLEKEKMELEKTEKELKERMRREEERKKAEEERKLKADQERIRQEKDEIEKQKKEKEQMNAIERRPDVKPRSARMNAGMKTEKADTIASHPTNPLEESLLLDEISTNSFEQSKASAKVSAVRPSSSLSGTFFSQATLPNTNPFLDDSDAFSGNTENVFNPGDGTESLEKKRRAPIPPQTKTPLGKPDILPRFLANASISGATQTLNKIPKDCEEPDVSSLRQDKRPAPLPPDVSKNRGEVLNKDCADRSTSDSCLDQLDESLNQSGDNLYDLLVSKEHVSKPVHFAFAESLSLRESGQEDSWSVNKSQYTENVSLESAGMMEVSKKKSRAPLPPAKLILTGEQNSTGLGSGNKTLPQAKVSPIDAQPVAELNIGGEPKRTGDSGFKPSRPHAVKPLSTIDNQTDFKENQDNFTSAKIAQGVQVSMKAPDAKGTGPYSQLTHEELVNLLERQKDQLSQKDAKIMELEQYIDNLLVRVIEEHPSILMSLSLMKKSV